MADQPIEHHLLNHLDAALRLATRLCGNPVDAEDIVQEAATIAIRKYDRFRGEAAFETWFCRILINVHRRRLTKRRAVHSSDGLVLAGPVDDPSEHAWGHQLGRLVAEMVSRLPPRQREAVVLIAYQGMALAQAAEAMQTTVDNVRVHLHHGRKKLRLQLKNHIEEVSP